MNEINFIIDKKECNDAVFEFYLKEHLNIRSIVLQSIIFYNSWDNSDFLDLEIMLLTLSLSMNNDTTRKIIKFKNLAEFCNRWQEIIKDVGVDYVKFYCNQNNYIIIELTEDKEFYLKQVLGEREDGDFELLLVQHGYHPLGGKSIVINNAYAIEIVKDWFGFRQEKFTKKGKYYSMKPLNFYRTNFFLRTNLIDEKSTLYNNEPSNIFCILPVNDGDQIKMQNYEPRRKRNIKQETNHLKFEITDENNKIVNFRGTPVKLIFSFEINEEK